MKEELSQMALTAMCEKCINHEMCKGTGCSDKKTLQKLVSKDVPQKVVYQRRVGYITKTSFGVYNCPTCGVAFTEELRRNIVDYCPKCGQHLIWELVR